MATYIKTADSVGFRSAYAGNAVPPMPTGKMVDELWAELGETVPTQTVANSSFKGVSLHNGEMYFSWAIGNSSANEYLVVVPRKHLKNLTIKLKASA